MIKLDTSREYSGEKSEYSESDDKTIVVGVRLKSKVINTLKSIAEERSKEGVNVNHTDLIREAIEKIYAKELGIDYIDVAFERIKAKNLKNPFTKLTNEEILNNFNTLLTDRMSFCLNIHDDFKAFINSHSLLRSQFEIDYLPRQSKAVYELEENSIVAENRTLHFKSQCSPVTIPTWEMAVYPSLKLSEIKKAMSNKDENYVKELYENTFKKAALHHILQEEKIFFKLLKQLSKGKDVYLLDDIQEFELGKDNSHYRILCPESKINALLKALNLKKNIENIHALIKADYIYSPTKFINIIKVSDDDLNKVVVLKKNDAVLAIDTGVTILPADDPLLLRIGWVIYEELGMFINNSKDIKFFDVTDKE
jgi:hypothetical protein